MDDQAAGMFGRLAPVSDARRVKTIILHNVTRRWAGFEKGRPRPFIQVEWGAGPDQAYRVGPAGTARTSSRQRQALVRRHAGFGLARRMSGPASRSMAHQSPTLYVVALLPLARSQMTHGLFAMAS
ncbi:hypothetical protein X737_22595 [Mesorhizobium sp. L48C026A00]|nr:hypothetical protein X737_22595 [Mesorhizobium sp. L48C026A00]